MRSERVKFPVQEYYKMTELRIILDKLASDKSAGAIVRIREATEEISRMYEKREGLQKQGLGIQETE